MMPAEVRRRTSAPRDLPAAEAAASPVMTDAEFALLRGLIGRESGIHLNDSKKALLQLRLGRRTRELGLRSFRAYYRRVVEERGEELTRMLDCVSTNETAFFRGPRHFEFLEDRVLAGWRGEPPRTIRAWSAGCATGEEPYSLAMVLLDHLSVHAGWRIEVLGTDLSTRALARARSGLWPVKRAREIPERFLKAFMLRGTGGQEGTMKAGPEVRAHVRFEHLNLHDETYALDGALDLIFCRNVLIYFDAAGRKQVVERLLPHLRPGGYLFLGQAESLAGLNVRVRCVGPNVYQAADRPPPGGAPRRGGPDGSPGR
jgi:chemotaxis protein methyltransferase CheR